MVYQTVQSQLMVKSFNNSFMNNANVKSHIQHKQQLNNGKKQQNQKNQRNGGNNKPQNLAAFNELVRELCNMYDAVRFFGKAEYGKKNSWRVLNKEQVNTATIYSIRYAPVVPRRNAAKKQQPVRQQKQQPKQQQQLRQQLRQQQPKQQQPRQQPKQQQQLRQQPRQQANKRQNRQRIGGCRFRPNVPRVYGYSTTPLPNNLYPVANNFNHLYDAFNYFGNSQIRNIKSWIESSRTHKLNSIASVFAKRNAPYVPVRQNRTNKRNQQQLRKGQQQQQRKIQKNIPRQQSNKRQQKNNNNKKPQQKLQINQQPLSNVWEQYYASPKHRMFK